MAATTSATAPNFQGMDVFWASVKPQIQNRHEAALAITHWIIISNGYHCIGQEKEVCSPRLTLLRTFGGGILRSTALNYGKMFDALLEVETRDVYIHRYTVTLYRGFPYGCELRYRSHLTRTRRAQVQNCSLRSGTTVAKDSTPSCIRIRKSPKRCFC